MVRPVRTHGTTVVHYGSLVVPVEYIMRAAGYRVFGISWHRGEQPVGVVSEVTLALAATSSAVFPAVHIPAL